MSFSKEHLLTPYQLLIMTLTTTYRLERDTRHAGIGLHSSVGNLTFDIRLRLSRRYVLHGVAQRGNDGQCKGLNYVAT